MSCGYSVKNRLKKASDFRHVFQRPRKIDMSMMASYARVNAKDAPRLGVIIAKKQVNKATRRNQIRRVVRESFRLNQQRLNHLDIIIMIKRPAKELSNQEIRVELDKVWGKFTSMHNNA